MLLIYLHYSISYRHLFISKVGQKNEHYSKKIKMVSDSWEIINFISQLFITYISRYAAAVWITTYALFSILI